MHPNPGKARSAPFRVFIFSLGAALCAQAALAQSTARSGPMQSGSHTPQAAGTQTQPLDVGKLFATSCGWCHSGGGREPGKGPRLMGTDLTDEQIASRIRNGKTGQMPAYATAFTEDQLRAIVAYIRDLKPRSREGKQ